LIWLRVKPVVAQIVAVDSAKNMWVLSLHILSKKRQFQVNGTLPPL
jgi:hypothetical protein